MEGESNERATIIFTCWSGGCSHCRDRSSPVCTTRRKRHPTHPLMNTDIFTMKIKFSVAQFAFAGVKVRSSKVLGVARLRQLRVRSSAWTENSPGTLWLLCQVKSNSCRLHHEFAKRSFLQGCYTGFSPDAEDQSSFGNDTLNVLTSKA